VFFYFMYFIFHTAIGRVKAIKIGNGRFVCVRVSILRQNIKHKSATVFTVDENKCC